MTKHTTSDKVQELRDRADGINPEERKNSQYWRGVRSAYREIAEELEQPIGTGSE